MNIVFDILPHIKFPFGKYLFGKIVHQIQFDGLQIQFVLGFEFVVCSIAIGCDHLFAYNYSMPWMLG